VTASFLFLPGMRDLEPLPESTLSLKGMLNIGAPEV
jgi:hypothetical protein